MCYAVVDNFFDKVSVILLHFFREERLLFSDDGDNYDDDDFEDDTVYEKIPTEPKDSDSAPADAE